LVIAIGFLDYYTGYKWGFSIFYLLPIILITYYNSLKHGIIVSVFSAIVWIIADYLSRTVYQHPLVPYWNAFIRLTYFLLITYLLARVKDSLVREKELARIDCSVGISNMRKFNEVADIELERSYRYQHPFSVAYMDLDNFKSVNDKFGHIVGNKALGVIAQIMQRSIRKLDTVARFGGDEFVILFPETDQNGAKLIIKRLQGFLNNEMLNNGWPVTFSIGVVTFVNRPINVEEMIKISDVVMYKVKNDGKNNIRYEVY
ncbi:MAG: GGDEF domain-containing protein, partial [Endomicrobiales bacterium]|nr:GGDEF domain-containing protein [Endomicrobiales bacterium]